MKVKPQWKNGRLIPIMDTEIADFPGEVWKYIPDYDVHQYDNYYQMSNMGRVKSLARDIDLHNGRIYRRGDKMLKFNITEHNEHSVTIQVRLSDTEGVNRYYSVPRILYELFVGPLEYENRSWVVKRKNNDPYDLDCSNLYLEEAGQTLCEPINQYDKEGKFLARYDSMDDAATALNITMSKIKDALRHEYLQGKAFFWRRGEPLDYIDISAWKIAKEQLKLSAYRPVQKLAVDGTPLEKYDSLKAAAKAMGHKTLNNIHYACSDANHTTAGYRWQYIDNDEATGNNIVNNYNKPVNRYNMKGNRTHTYPSPAQAAKELGVSNGSILNAITREKVTVKESYWRYVEPDDMLSIDVSGYKTQRDNYKKAAKKRVQKLTLEGKPLEIYESITSAANAVGIRSNALLRAVRNNGICKGFRWRHAEE
jgi:hypothetical protein